MGVDVEDCRNRRLARRAQKKAAHTFAVPGGECEPFQHQPLMLDADAFAERQRMRADLELFTQILS